MKRMLAAGSIVALATVGLAGTANAAPAEPAGSACFGQVHKAVNTASAVEGIDNVGQLVQALGGGQNKNATAKTFC